MGLQVKAQVTNVRSIIVCFRRQEHQGPVLLSNERERERTLAWEQIQHCHLMSFASQDRSAHCIAKPHVCHIYIYCIHMHIQDVFGEG